jgi:hypothetical protein
MPRTDNGKQMNATMSKGQKQMPTTHIPRAMASTLAKTTHPAGEIFFFIKGGKVLPQ